VHSLLYANSIPTPVEAEAARRAAERAVALAADRSEGHRARGRYHALIRGDLRRAFREDSTALALTPGAVDLMRAIATDQLALGDAEGARARLEQASRLDPRSVVAASGLGLVLLFARRYGEAAAAFDRALELRPANLGNRESRAMVELGRGELAAARRVLQAAPPEVDPAALAAYVADFWDLYWVLDDTQQQLALDLPPSAYDDDRATWAILRTQMYALRGDNARTRAWADTARVQIGRQLQDTPDDFQRHAFLGLAFAHLGRKADAIREGERSAALMPLERDVVNGAYARHQLARIYVLTGEPDKALDQLETLLKVPYFLSPGWLRIDPNFAPLKGNPRFVRLIAGS
jgi:serine/threonine-protein kinase